MIFRFRDELREGEDVETALVETMTHAGRSVIVSGSTVAVGLLSMVILPLPFIRSIGIGGMLIPAVSVIAAITLLPAMLSVARHAHQQRARAAEAPRRHGPSRGRLLGPLGEPRHAPTGADRARRARDRRRARSSTASSSTRARRRPRTSRAPATRSTAGPRSPPPGISPGVMKPFVVLVEHGAEPGAPIVAKLDATPGRRGRRRAAARWRKDGDSLIEAFPSADGAAKSVRRRTIRRRSGATLKGTGRRRLGGVAPEDRDFVNAVYGNFPYVLAFVILLTFILLARAFRSLVLPLKAVILNLISLGAAYGIIVFIFQKGHGSEAIWDVARDPVDHLLDPADDLRVPVRALDGLRGLHAHAACARPTTRRATPTKAISLGLARTGKLVTSAALVLMFAFFVLSSSPGTDIKQFGIGLAAGIIFDATVIRALLVPSIMRLLGDWNW